MSIAKPFTFVANTHAKSSEVNANFDTVYSQVNSNISAISQNAVDIENLENNKADINGNTAQRFAVADAITDSDAISKRMLRASIANSIDYISGFTITKDSGSPNNTIIVSEGSCYDSTKTVVLNKTNSSTKTNDNQAANATYYVYVIGNATGSQVDVLISESGVTPGLPSGYILYRQIGYYTTDSVNKIDTISFYGLDFISDKSINGIISKCMPDYSAGISLSVNTDIVLAQDSFIVITGANGGGAYDNMTSFYINGQYIAQIPSTYKVFGTSFSAYVGKGETVRVQTSTGVNNFVAYPLKGETNA